LYTNIGCCVLLHVQKGDFSNSLPIYYDLYGLKTSTHADMLFILYRPIIDSFKIYCSSYSDKKARYISKYN
jgi:hypothetical protein